MQLRRSQLFVPGNDERKIRKALGLPDCDSIIFDLEDSVPPSEKSAARLTIKQVLSDFDWGTVSKGREICLRINPSDSPFWKDDVAYAKEDKDITSVVIPKSDQRFTAELHALLPEKNLLPLVESARGLLEIEGIAKCGGVCAISFGAADFAKSVGGNVEAYMQNIYIKTQIAVVSKAYGVDPIDNVYFDLSNLDGLRAEATQSKNLGYVGKQVIHPSQVEIANGVFSPSSEEIEYAKKVIGLYEKAQSEKIGALRMDDQLVDAVHYRQAKQVLEKKALIDDLSAR